MSKIFKVGTFAELITRPGRSKIWRISAYTRYYSPSWDRCIEYEVEANTGKEAKKIAMRKRRAFEEAAHRLDAAREE